MEAVTTRPPSWLSVGTRGVLIVLVVVAGAWVRGPSRSDAGDTVSALVATGAAVLLLVRARRPVLVLAAVVCVGVASSFGGSYSLGLLVAVMIAAYGVADRRGRGPAVLAAATAAIAVTGAQWAVSSLRVETLAFVASATAWGLATRSRRLYLEALEERAERAESTRESEARRRVAEERLTIARDLHDTVAHQVTVINLHAAAASAAVRERPDDAEEALVTIRGAARTVLKEIADLLTALRSSGDPVPGPAPELSAASAVELVVATAREAGMQISTRITGAAVLLPDVAVRALARVLQESLTNARRHGAPAPALVHLEQAPDRAALDITNVVRPEALPSDGFGFGLVGMRERLEIVGGMLEAGPVGDGTWRVRAVIPVAAGGTAPSEGGSGWCGR